VILPLARGGGKNDGDVGLLRPREGRDSVELIPAAPLWTNMFAMLPSDVQRSTTVGQHERGPVAHQREEQQDPRQRESGSVT